MRLYSALAIVFGVLSVLALITHQLLVISCFESGQSAERVVCTTWIIGVHSVIYLIASVASSWISCWPQRNK